MFQSHSNRTLTELTANAERPDTCNLSAPQPLARGREREALAFLNARPIHTVVMASCIRDNGLDSPLNRGTFYGYRDAAGRLTGIALIGRTVLAEARTDAALAAFATQTRACPQAYLIMGEESQIARFWQHYADPARLAQQDCYELLLLRQRPAEVSAPINGLRPATVADLDAVLLAHVDLLRSERGVNSLEADPEGLRARTIRRIEQGRVWVWLEDGPLLFKSDVVSETPAVSYIEGVYVHPSVRGQGYGLRCLAQLSRELLSRTDALCLLANEQNLRARDFYLRADFVPTSRYRTLFLHPHS